MPKRRRSPAEEAGRLREVRRRDHWDGDWDCGEYPFSIPAVAALGSLGALPVGDITFLVGENGTGKSTLVEAIAVRAGLNREGGSRNLMFETRDSSSELHAAIELAWDRRPARAFFLRAETFYNMATAYEHEDIGIGGYHEQSHGESFLDAVDRQIVPGSFVLMDEPESALSVVGQLKLMSLMHDLVAERTQFLVATHSPILLAYPGATIYELGDGGIEAVSFDDSGPVRLTRSFLDDPERFLRRLFD